MKSHAVGDHESQAAALLRRNQVQTLLLRVGYRFFEKYMFARVKAIERGAVMQVVRKGNEHGVDIVQEIVIVTDNLDPRQLLRSQVPALRLDLCRSSDYCAIGHLREASAVLGAHATAADQTQS